MYVVLVGPPGIGKTVVTSEIDALWLELKDHHVAPTSLTKAALIDMLVAAKRKIVRPGEDPNFVEFNSLLLVSNELGTMLPSYEGDFMSVLTDIYDCKRYGEARRTEKLRHEIPNPQLNFLAATTPSYLNGLLPDGAWDQGFLSRTILVYSGIITRSNPFLVLDKGADKREVLSGDLKMIGELYGQMQIAEDAAAAIVAWNASGGSPAPDHPKLQHYNTRRLGHLLKLSMVASVSRANELIIRLEDYAKALSWLVEMETFIPDIFKAMNTGGDTAVMDECKHFVYKTVLRTQKPVPEHLVVRFLKEKLPAHSIGRALEVMEKAHMLKVELIPGVAGKSYTAGVTDL
jgi:hypothetical protein